MTLLSSVYAWVMKHMWNEDGFFYYRVLRSVTIRTSYMRWSQAWMLLALSTLAARCQCHQAQRTSARGLRARVNPPLAFDTLNDANHKGLECLERSQEPQAEAQTSTMVSEKTVSKPPSRKRILLVSNLVMHYRVSVYNAFHRRFDALGYEFSVLADALQKENKKPLEFEFHELPFSYSKYCRTIKAVSPDAVILFLRLKDLIIWPLIHWLKFQRIPFAIWTKGCNWDAKGKSLTLSTLRLRSSYGGRPHPLF